MFRPYRHIVDIIRDLVWKALQKCKIDFDKDNIKVEETKSRIYGDFFTTVAFSVAKKYFGEKFRENAVSLAERIASKINKIKPSIIACVRAENGYINFFLDRGLFAKFVIEGISHEWEKYGVFTSKRRKVIVEHTSANPIHPLHIGHARNAFIGDCLARINQFIGNEVSRRFYVNDCGRQVAVLMYGLRKLKNLRSNGVKLDHLCGAVYSCTASLLEANKNLKKLMRIVGTFRNTLRKSISKEKHHSFVMETLIRSIALGQDEIAQKIKAIVGDSHEVASVVQEIENLIKNVKISFEILSSVASKWPRIYYRLNLRIDSNADTHIRRIMQRYERGDKETVSYIRETVSRILGAIINTLKTLHITFDAFDWESDLIWKGLVDNITNELVKRGYAYRDPETGALFLNVQKILTDFPEMREFYFEGKSKTIKIENVKNPVLIRRDGTSLYLLRDIAYAYYKLQSLKVDVSINVIGVDQKLEQKHVVLALRALGIEDVLSRYKHVAYELIRLPGRKMSSRRGQYVSLDEIVIEAIRRAYEEITHRYERLSNEQKYALAKEIAIGAIKYALLSQAPTKVITFDWKRVLDFEQNSGPFIQYAHARAASILRKISWKIPDKCDLSLLKTPEEFEVIYKLSKFPEVLEEVIETHRPDLLVEYTNELAMLFNKFYQKHPVLKAENEELKKARLMLVATFRRVIATAMKLLGITPLYRM